MNECTYNYTLEDNLAMTKYLFKLKNRRKTGIVNLLVIGVSILGLMVSIGGIIARQSYWTIGIASIILIVGYFMVDKIALWKNQKKQKEFFLSSDLSKVTKVRVTFQEDEVSETFLIKEKILGVNKYLVSDLSNLKVEKDYIFLVFKEQNIVLLKKQCMSNKTMQEFNKLRENLTNRKEKVKINKK